MRPAELIERKRDGEELGRVELAAFLSEYMEGGVAEYQMAAMLMAVFFRGLSPEELSTLTRAIVDSGDQLDFRGRERPSADKHSTGGVGDKVSLVLAPLLAEYGIDVPMMSGRGLGHTGGTLDKLESIPGFRTNLSLSEFREIVDRVGCAMIGQTRQIAPLDGRLYALRDVTGTVQSIPLISASIVSKKVAEGIGALVLDVKVGDGAFMTDVGRARELAVTMVELAASFGLETSALLTRMDEPLGEAVGNALEVREAVACLTGGGPPDLRELTLALSAEAVSLVRSDVPVDEARRDLADVLDSGRAADRFRRLVEEQGGDPAVVDDPTRLPAAPEILELSAPESGRVELLPAREIGLVAVGLGAGRRAMGDDIDPAVGVEVLVRGGQEVARGTPFARIHARSPSAAETAAARLAQLITVGSGGAAPDDGIVIEEVRTRSRP